MAPDRIDRDTLKKGEIGLSGDRAVSLSIIVRNDFSIISTRELR